MKVGKTPMGFWDRQWMQYTGNICIGNVFFVFKIELFFLFQWIIFDITTSKLGKTELRPHWAIVTYVYQIYKAVC